MSTSEILDKLEECDHPLQLTPSDMKALVTEAVVSVLVSPDTSPAEREKIGKQFESLIDSKGSSFYGPDI